MRTYTSPRRPAVRGERFSSLPYSPVDAKAGMDWDISKHYAKMQQRVGYLPSSTQNADRARREGMDEKTEANPRAGLAGLDADSASGVPGRNGGPGKTCAALL